MREERIEIALLAAAHRQLEERAGRFVYYLLAVRQTHTSGKRSHRQTEVHNTLIGRVNERERERDATFACTVAINAAIARPLLA